MKALGNSSVTVKSTGRSSLSAVYDHDMQMTLLTTTCGETRLETYLPTHQLAEILAQAFDAAASDPSSIGFDTWAGTNNPRLSHIPGGAA